MKANSNHRPVFIVGASRSGTELLRSILNQHPSVCVSTETHYFDDLRSRLRGREKQGLTENEARRCADYFRAVMHRPYGHSGQPENSPLSLPTLRETAAKIGTGADAFFEAFCRLDARQKGAERWGEKTPRHIFCLPEIFRAFPEAQVICMVRDPRAVVASYRDWKNMGGFDFDKDPGHKAVLEREEQRVRRSYNILITCLMWSGSIRATVEGRKRFTSEQVFIQRYEDLICNPASALSTLAAWLSLDFHSAMLNAPVTNSSFATFERSAGFAKPSIDRWRTKLNRHEIAVIQTCCVRLMRCTHYHLDPVGTPLCPLLWECLKLPAATINAAAANRSRIGAIVPYVCRRIRFAIGGLIGGTDVAEN